MTAPRADLIIFCGQSNMQGQTDCLSECEVVPSAYEYRFLTDAYVPLKNPVGENITPAGEAGFAYVAALAAARYAYTVENIYFVWLQGESDAISGRSKEYYKAELIRLSDSLCEEFGITRFGIIRVGIFTGDERDFAIIEAQDEVCRENDRFAMLTDVATELFKQPEYMNPCAYRHYSAKGQELLGSLAGAALADLQ